MNLLFGLFPLRFTFIARQPVYFPEGKSANILRGALGTVFRRIACLPRCVGPRSCQRTVSCAYARTFEPTALIEAHAKLARGAAKDLVSPSGLSDWPRPFVFRASHLDGHQFHPGAQFHFDLHLFELQTPPLPYLVEAFSELARDGLGSRRSRVELTGVWQLNAQRRPAIHLLDGYSLTEDPLIALQIDLARPEQAVNRVRVRFVTPTELKRGREVLERPEFGALAPRIRDRISTLRWLYGEGPLDIDFKGFGERAALVKLLDYQTKRCNIVRRSSRTGQTHPIGGFIGQAEYEGDLTEFVPYLCAAEWIGVGRQTVWGKGEIATEVLG